MLCDAALKALQNSMMLRPRWPSAGPIGGEGFACPAGTSNLIYPTTFLAIFLSLARPGPLEVSGPAPHGRLPPLGIKRDSVSADLLDLTIFKLDRRRPAKNGNRDLKPLALLIHLLNEAAERGKRSIGDANLFADFKADRRFRPLDPLLNLVEDARGFRVGDRNWLAV